MEWLRCMFLVFCFGCASPEQEATATYTHDHVGIEFKYPETWVVTDNDKGSSSSLWLVVSSTPFSPIEGILIGFKPADMSIIAEQIQSFKDEGINLIESQTKIGSRNATKLEASDADAVNAQLNTVIESLKIN